MKTKQIVQKIKNKVVNQWVHKVPYQQNYRPIGYYPNISGENSLVGSEDATYIQIYPAYPTDINLQDPFYQLCNEALRPQPAPITPPSFIISIPNGRIQQNYLGHCTTVISGGNKLVEDISYEATNTRLGAPAAEMDIFKQKYFTTPQKYKGTVFSMLAGTACSTNYYHWLYDCIPRLHLLKQSGLFDRVDYFLVPALIQKFHKEVLNFLGLEGKKIIECEKFIHLQADNLIVSSHVCHREIVPKWACDFHRNNIIDKVAPANPTELIYIPRGDSNIRQVLNEDKLMAMLEKYGFKNVTLSKLPFEEQARQFASARIIVAAHGAGLANISFCKEGTHLIEFFSEYYVKPLYQLISKKREIAYNYLICESERDKKPQTLFEANKSHIIADVDAIEKALNRSLEQTIQKSESPSTYSPFKEREAGR
jgi:hypothetical protein